MSKLKQFLSILSPRFKRDMIALGISIVIAVVVHILFKIDGRV